MQTRPGICQRKRRYATREEADAVALRADVTLRTYKCALCGQFHLTGRTKGLKAPRPPRADRAKAQFRLILHERSPMRAASLPLEQ